MPAPTVIKVGCTPDGYRLRVEGRGTLRESPAVVEFAGHALREPGATLVVDLAGCDYLDSTFLGCLVLLQKRLAGARPPRLRLRLSPEVAERVFLPNRLSTLFCLTDEPPEVIGAEEALPLRAVKADDLGQHIMECHRRLAETDGPNRAAFGEVADGLARELAGGRSATA